ncbi:hypothetical protein [Methylocaldum szegediense]|uniref:hypothetical protein n=1 Tax=Methylocaldum szegediense TaxID=73780 RepID=UPI000419A6D3|nr:hypothetical protein [Methylocaldum szegediense]
MERSLLRGAILIGLSLAHAGCAMFGRFDPVDFYERDPKYSLALQIALATGLTRPNVYTGKPEPINDVPRAQLAAALKGTGSGAAGRELLHAAGLATGVRKLTGAGIAPPGFSLPAAGAMSILGVLTSGPTVKHPALVNHIIAWMPKREAATPGEARLKFRDLVVNAYLETLPAPYSVKETMDITPYGIVETGYILQGGDCGTPPVKCVLEPYVNEPAEAQTGPSWVDRGAVYVWQNYLPGRTGRYPQASVEAYRFDVDSSGRHRNARKLALAGESEQLQKMSALLPDWVYIYSAPTDERPYPVIFHRGKTLYFIEPENESKNQKDKEAS